MGKYNLVQIKDKDAAYRNLIRAELLDELYDQVFQRIIVEKKYRDPDYSAKKLAEEIKTNTRYISAVVSLRFGMNYSSLINEYRIKEALAILVDKRYADATIEEISAMVGFANRQSFYAAFYKFTGQTPKGYRLKHQTTKGTAKKSAKSGRTKETK
ncbi:MAG: AraC family transcriptional regulator [Bacteroidaceae bacterium]|nr:AraC family transcriptional regulator [Bacteroidaceae bacterium]